MREALSRVDEVYEHLKPHERRELFKLLLRSVEVGERQIVLEIYAGGASDGTEAPDRQRLRGRLEWLPGAVPHSVIVDRFRCGGAVSGRFRRRVGRATTADQALAWAAMLARGDVANRADLAERAGVSRARVTQVLGRKHPA